MLFMGSPFVRAVSTSRLKEFGRLPRTNRQLEITGDTRGDACHQYSVQNGVGGLDVAVERGALRF